MQDAVPSSGMGRFNNDEPALGFSVWISPERQSLLSRVKGPVEVGLRVLSGRSGCLIVIDEANFLHPVSENPSVFSIDK